MLLRISHAVRTWHLEGPRQSRLLIAPHLSHGLTALQHTLSPSLTPREERFSRSHEINGARVQLCIASGWFITLPSLQTLPLDPLNRKTLGNVRKMHSRQGVGTPGSVCVSYEAIFFGRGFACPKTREYQGCVSRTDSEVLDVPKSRGDTFIRLKSWG